MASASGPRFIKVRRGQHLLWHRHYRTRVARTQRHFLEAMAERLVQLGPDVSGDRISREAQEASF